MTFVMSVFIIVIGFYGIHELQTANRNTEVFYLMIFLSLACMIFFSFYIVRNINNLIHNLNDNNQKMADNEEKYRALIEYAGDSIIILDENLVITDANDSACRLFGYSHHELINMQSSKVLSKEDAEWQYMCKQIIETSKNLLSEKKIKRKDGSEVETEINTRLLEGKGYISIVRDISERKKTEVKLKQSEEKYRSLIEHAGDAIFLIDDNTMIVDANQSACEILGYTLQEFLTMKGEDIYDPEELKKQPIAWELLRKVKSLVRERVLLRKDGTKVEVEINAKVLEGQGYLAIIRDITERKRIESELTERKSQLDLFIEHSPASLAMFDNEMKYIAMSRRWITDYHLKDHELVGKSHYEIFPEIREDWKEFHQRCLQGAIETNEEDFFIRADGNVEWLRWEIHPWHKATGEIGGIIMFTEVITERKKAEEIIKQSESNYRQLFNLSPAPMWVVDTETEKFAQVNKACIDKYGYSEKEFTEMTIDNISVMDDAANNQMIRSKNRVYPFFKHEGRHIKKSGEIIEVETSSIPLILNGKKQTLVIAIDVTEKNLYEQKLTMAALKAQEEERYEIGGELHDNVCQILATSLIYLGMMKKPLPAESKPIFEQTHQYITQATHEIRNISHRLAPAFFDDATLEDAFKKLLMDFNAENKYETKLTFNNASRIYPLSRDLQLNLYRILQEQLRNILKHANASKVEVEVAIQNDILQMKIEDNGKGFNMESSRGGIGLANMNKRVQLFSGNFSVDSKVGNGCEILVEIPLSNMPLTAFQ